MNLKSAGLSLFLYLAGVLLGLVLLGLSAWANSEAFMFDTALTSDKRLQTMNCPLIITDKGTGTVSASFSNKADRDVRRTVRSRITDGLISLWREDRKMITIPSGESTSLEWQFTSEDAVYDKFVLARVYLFRAYPYPSSTGTCGVVVLPISFLTGTQVTVLGLGLMALLSGSGIALWRRRISPIHAKYKDVQTAMTILAGLVFAGLIIMILNWWVLGEGVFILSAMLLIVATLYFLRAL